MFKFMSFRLLSFEDGFTFNFFGLYIGLPFLKKWHREPEEIMDAWGVYYDEHHSIVFCWGNSCKFFHLPWQFEHYSCEILAADGSWIPYQGYDEDHSGLVQTFPYRYVLQSGVEQNVTATVTVERRVWYWKWCKGLKWLQGWPSIKRQSIDVRFSDEVGERAGSWKGGCIGCGYEMKPGETAEQTLRRMESERKFK